MRIRPNSGTQTINLEQLKAILKSVDENELNQMSWVYDGDVKFLDGSTQYYQKIALASFPRSGNTFIRKYLELLTGVQTGGDNCLHFNVDFQMLGSKGEEIVDDSVFIVKTHYPWVPPSPTQFNSSQMLVITRNPLDSIMSWLEYLTNHNHSTRAPFNYATDYPRFLDWWIRQQIPKIRQFFDVYMAEAKSRKCPILFIRFEDLVINPRPSLENLMKFILGM